MRSSRAGFSAVPLDIETLAPGRFAVGALNVDDGRVTHDEASFGFRLSRAAGPGLAYSGDCGRADDLRGLIRPGDTLLSEVSFGPGPVPRDAAHLDGPSVGALAAATGVERVLLTHLLMGYDEAGTVASVQRAFAGPVELVRPGDRYTIGG
jgi:ribonuclease BN (tRNA processing enzyme)